MCLGLLVRDGRRHSIDHYRSSSSADVFALKRIGKRHQLPLVRQRRMQRYAGVTLSISPHWFVADRASVLALMVDRDLRMSEERGKREG